MKKAVQMAEMTVGQTSPNPSVGCVIVNNGEVVGTGVHLKAGGPHAERHALSMAGELAEGADAYVTLEPCSHTGRTPPCAEALIEAGVKRVFTASDDPDPRVSGRGIQMLRDAGIEVVTNVLKGEADELNRFFFHYIHTQRPYVTLKMATSIDGKTATASGESQWITGPESREDGHRLRRTHDAILTGINTVETDDPSLTVRLPEGGMQPLRVVLDTTLRFPEQARLLQDGGGVRIFTTEQAPADKVTRLREKGASVTVLPSFRIDVPDVLDMLGSEQVQSLLVEGGASIHDSFLRSGLFEQVVHYSAPILIGGEKAPGAAGGSGTASLSGAPRLHRHDVTVLGNDLRIIYRRKEEQ
ncbi:bifunctional diaminohydroxyphosphoribosylaminopyrimidine deaminase/5-amino-6-(5-phosphoribosylamino)uracil reductase RibD [Alkalicoccus urumqiensis]|uniref:Riboflavin biosynthesis protein RibD n=1 Tax=Alkalicoccus urumqiensis TaxID=1548213 RepID=A0A2P6ML11_ALKUR|nr:bifunctional diaminohydroxyphosphoribosylaminopyrimidine deaminase/5-amino-6-(5-phosphoribosylamino)uracil reductase RibD [Alkalicoccus urumqiensis]PRO66970.1 bifunctional diaminohydroxyphosphoribosylaminopyrimidine deaminase/5-amino-6-(5-phosphoribosylamino)uracil reductase RibD [Alkalicoccus urumqiensis]